MSIGTPNAALRIRELVDHTPMTRFEDVFRADIMKIARESAMKLQNQAGVHADLVVIGHGKIHETLGRLRTNGYMIIRDAPCPVLSL